MGNQWREKFDDAEVSPPEALWDKIASDLDTNKKGGARFPPLLGWAATIAVVLLSGVVVYQNTSNFSSRDQTELVNKEIAKNEPTQNILAQHNEESVTAQKVPLEINASIGIQETHETESSRNTLEYSSTKAASKPGAFEIENSNEDSPMSPLIAKSEESDSNFSELKTESEVTEIEVAGSGVTENGQTEEVKTELKPVQEKFEYPSADDLLIEQNHPVKSKSRKIWVGAAQGVGGYSNQLSGTNGGVGLSANDPTFTLERAINSVQTEPQKMNEQLSLNTALQLGLPVGDKLTIITGFTYNRSNFTSNAATINGELLHFTSDNIQLNSTDGFSSFQTVDLKGTYDMAVMPVLADLTILSGNFNWTVQAGPEIGFLIKQQIENKDLGLSRSTGPGDLYQSLHLRVAFGTTFTYGLGNHFQMSFQPVMEQAVTSITTPDAPFESRPLYYSALFGLRYML